MGASSQFDGKVVIVTGAAGGLGRAFAQGFAAEGAQLVVADIDQAGVEETASGDRNAMEGVTQELGGETVVVDAKSGMKTEEPASKAPRS